MAITFGELEICICCLLVAANGECCAEPHEHEPLSTADGHVVADSGETLGFHYTHRCDGCGSYLGGDRYRAWMEIPNGKES